MTKDVLKYLQPNAAIPIDMETTSMLVNALKDAYAEQEPDELNIAYMSGLYDGKKKSPWVGLTEERIKDIWLKGKDHGDDWEDVLALARAFEAELKKVNT
jgi:hypothetical protein